MVATAPKPFFSVPVADLELGLKRVSWTLDRAYLDWAFSGSEAAYLEDGLAQLELSKNGREVLVRGDARVKLTLPCMWTMEPVPVEVTAELTLLLTPKSGADGDRPARRRRRELTAAKADVAGATVAGATPAATEPKRAAKPAGKEGGARGRDGASTNGWASDPELTDTDAARDHFDGDHIVLDGFLREFILLEFPMTVRKEGLREDDSRATPSSPISTGARADAGPEASADALGHSMVSGRGAEPAPSAEIDPRLAPLLAIANRMRAKKE